MTEYITIKHSQEDEPGIEMAGVDSHQLVYLDNTDQKQNISTNLAAMREKLGEFSLLHRELWYLAAAIYSVDRRLPRNSTAYDRWTRDIHVFYPVLDIAKWNSAKELLEAAVSFVSGDRWTFTFYQSDALGSLVDKEENKVEDQAAAVNLLSGGLDSFVGAIDLLENNVGKIALISHHNSGSMERTFQQQVVAYLASKYPERFLHFNIFVNPYTGQKRSELSSRSRSFMYFVFGVIIAEKMNSGIFSVPENGYISLNIPLNAMRIGSLSSRTTHPYFVELFHELINALEISVEVASPYRFKTKGEMLVEVSNPEVLKQGYAITMSCSSASSHRFQGYSPKTHCGNCMPCIVRRAALYKAGLSDDGEYVVDVLALSPMMRRKYSDLFALEVAIRRYQQNTPTMFDVIGNATLPDRVGDYVAVYQRGVEELEEFLAQCK